MIKELITLADILDRKGFAAEANALDKLIKKAIDPPQEDSTIAVGDIAYWPLGNAYLRVQSLDEGAGEVTGMITKPFIGSIVSRGDVHTVPSRVLETRQTIEREMAFLETSSDPRAEYTLSRHRNKLSGILAEKERTDKQEGWEAGHADGAEQRDKEWAASHPDDMLNEPENQPAEETREDRIRYWDDAFMSGIANYDWKIN